MRVIMEVRQSGVTPDEFKHILNNSFKQIKRGLKLLGEETKNHMQQVIKTSKRRVGSQERLENSITVTPLGSGGVGIGNIVTMDQLAPYWYLINYGGFTVAAKRGLIVPGSFGSNSAPDKAYKGTGIGYERWNYQKGGPFFMLPQSPIMAMNYIEKTSAWVNTVIKPLFMKWTQTKKI